VRVLLYLAAQRFTLKNSAQAAKFMDINFFDAVLVFATMIFFVCYIIFCIEICALKYCAPREEFEK